MTDNTQINTGSGDIIRTIQRTSSKTQVIQLDAGGEAGPESLVTSTNPLPVSSVGAPQPVYLDDQNVPLDDNGYQIVSTNFDGSDVATQSAQQVQTAVLQQIAAGSPSSQLGPWYVGITSQPIPALAPNASQELAGQLQRVADFLELLLIEARTHTILMANLNQAQQEDPEKIRADMNMSLQ